MPNWLEGLKRWFGQAPREMPPLSPRDLQKVIGEVGRTEDIEYSCDDAYQLLDAFAEAVLRGEDVARLMPLVHKHLEMCPDCREEFEALLLSLRAAPV